MKSEANYTVHVDENLILNEGESMVRKRRRVFWLGLVSIVVITGIIAIVVSQSKQSNSNRTDFYGNYFECIVFDSAGTSLNETFTEDDLFCESSDSMYLNTSVVKITGNTSEFFAGRDFLRNEIKLRFPMSIINERREIDVDFSMNSIEIVKTLTVRKISDHSNGVKEMLIVRVSGPDSGIKWTEDQIADAYFNEDYGISGHFSRCSDQKLSIVPVTGHKNGVLNVNISQNVCRMHYRGLTKLVDAQLPSDLLNGKSYISYVLPDCVNFKRADGLGIVLGNRNWMKSKFSRFPAFGLVVFGFNIGFRTSRVADDRYVYADGSCYMGGRGAIFLNTVPSRMCFNAHKTWLTKWFSNYHKEINPSDKAFSGNLVGINDIITKEAESKDISVLHIQGGSVDLYLMYNRKEGINSGVAKYGDEVVIIGAEGPDKVSYVLGRVGSSNKTFIKKNWVEKRTLVIHLCKIATGQPDRASIIVFVKGKNFRKCGGNGSPPSVPTSSPIAKPTSEIGIVYVGCFRRNRAFTSILEKKKDAKSPEDCSTFCDLNAGSNYTGTMLLTAGQVCRCIQSNHNPGIQEKASPSSKCSSVCSDGSECGAQSTFHSLYRKTA